MGRFGRVGLALAVTVGVALPGCANLEAVSTAKVAKAGGAAVALNQAALDAKGGGTGLDAGRAIVKDTVAALQADLDMQFASAMAGDSSFGTQGLDVHSSGTATKPAAKEPPKAVGDQIKDKNSAAKDKEAAAREHQAAAKDREAAATEKEAAAKELATHQKAAEAAATEKEAAAKEKEAAAQERETAHKDPNASGREKEHQAQEKEAAAHKKATEAQAKEAEAHVKKAAAQVKETAAHVQEQLHKEKERLAKEREAFAKEREALAREKEAFIKAKEHEAKAREEAFKIKAKHELAQRKEQTQGIKKFEPIDNGDGTKTHKVELTVNRKDIKQYQAIEKTVDSEDGAVVGEKHSLAKVLPDGRAVKITRSKTLNEDGTWTTTFRSETKGKEDKIKIVEWTRTTGEDGSESGEGTITRPDGSKVHVKVTKTVDGHTTTLATDSKAKIEAEITKGELDAGAKAKVTDQASGQTLANIDIADTETVAPSED